MALEVRVGEVAQQLAVGDRQALLSLTGSSGICASGGGYRHPAARLQGGAEAGDDAESAAERLGGDHQHLVHDRDVRGEDFHGVAHLPPTTIRPPLQVASCSRF